MKNGIEYARYTKSSTVKHGVTYHNNEYLGRVINKEAGLFKSRARGLFGFDLKDGYKAPDPTVLPTKDIVTSSLEITFGDVWLFENKIKKLGLEQILESLFPNDADTIKSLIAFRLLSEDPFCFTKNWYVNSYAQILYPNASLDSSQISSFQKKLGTEEIYLQFFDKYLSYLTNDENLKTKISLPVLIDSTKLVNNIKSHYTQCSRDRNEKSENVIRLIYVVDKKTNLPIFFRFVPGNIIDQSTLKTTINSLYAHNISLELVILDAGYRSYR
jgi:hypothetical protein